MRYVGARHGLDKRNDVIAYRATVRKGRRRVEWIRDKLGSIAAIATPGAFPCGIVGCWNTCSHGLAVAIRAVTLNVPSDRPIRGRRWLATRSEPIHLS